MTKLKQRAKRRRHQLVERRRRSVRFRPYHKMYRRRRKW